LNQAALFHPDLILLDLGLPDLDGVEVVRRLREWSGVPVIILSVREQEADKVGALDAGADDYLTKPFGMGELLARLRVVLRRNEPKEEEPVLTLGSIVLDRARRLVTVDGREMRLTPTEYEILKTLAHDVGRVITNRQLLRSVWGPGYENETHYLRVYVGQLRRKLEKNPSRPEHLLTEPSVGYRLV
jgi:two-component system KDP operon response regulator KdpE